jgi:hypothetical protein
MPWRLKKICWSLAIKVNQNYKEIIEGKLSAREMSQILFKKLKNLNGIFIELSVSSSTSIRAELWDIQMFGRANSDKIHLGNGPGHLCSISDDCRKHTILIPAQFYIILKLPECRHRPIGECGIAVGFTVAIWRSNGDTLGWF